MNRRKRDINRKERTMSNNGELNDKEKAIQDGKTCQVCKSRFPREAPLLMATPPLGTSQKIVTRKAQNKVLVVAAYVCGDSDSSLFQCIVTGQNSCESFDMDTGVIRTPQVRVSSKIKNRLKGN